MNEAEEVKITETIDVVVTKKDGLSLEKFWSKMPKRITVKTAIIISAIIILAAVGYVYKGLFVAATVNGYPISRLAVVRELEKAAGKNTLDALINKKLVSDEAGKQYIKTNKVDVPNGEDAQLNEQIKNSLIQQKLNSEAAAFIKNLRSEYKVNYFVNY